MCRSRASIGRGVHSAQRSSRAWREINYHSPPIGLLRVSASNLVAFSENLSVIPVNARADRDSNRQLIDTDPAPVEIRHRRGPLPCFGGMRLTTKQGGSASVRRSLPGCTRTSTGSGRAWSSTTPVSPCRMRPGSRSRLGKGGRGNDRWPSSASRRIARCTRAKRSPSRADMSCSRRFGGSLAPNSFLRRPRFPEWAMGEMRARDLDCCGSVSSSEGWRVQWETSVPPG